MDGGDLQNNTTTTVSDGSSSSEKSMEVDSETKGGMECHAESGGISSGSSSHANQSQTSGPMDVASQHERTGSLKRKRVQPMRNVRFAAEQKEMKKRVIAKTLEVNKTLTQKLEKNMRQRVPSTQASGSLVQYPRVAKAQFKPKFQPVPMMKKGEIPVLWTRQDLERFVHSCEAADEAFFHRSVNKPIENLNEFI